MFAVCIVEKVDVDSPVIDERRCHIPITYDHPQMAAVLAEHDLEEERKRSASSDDKKKILAALEAMNGNISEDILPSDILEAAGVDRKQGTASFARYHIKQKLLTYKKTSSDTE